MVRTNQRHATSVLVILLALTLAACGADGSPTTTATAGGATVENGGVAATDETGCPADATYQISALESGVSFSGLPLSAMINFDTGAPHGLTVTSAQFAEGGGSTSQVFLSGTGDILSSGLNAVLAIGGEEGVEDANVTVLATSVRYVFHKVVAKAGSEIASVEDLRGTTIGVSGVGSFSWVVLNWWLKEHGIDPETDVEIAGIGGPPALVAAIESNAIDVALLTLPTYNTAVAEGIVQLVHDFTTDEDLGEIPSISFAARTEDVVEEPCKFAAFVDTFVDTVDRMRTDRDFALEVATAEWGESIEQDLLVELLDEWLLDPAIWSLDGTFTEEQYDNTVRVMSAADEYDPSTFPTFDALTGSNP